MEEKTDKEVKFDTYISFIDTTDINTTKNNNIRMEKITIEGKIKWNKKTRRKLKRKLKKLLRKLKKEKLVTSCNQHKEEEYERSNKF